MSCRAEAGLKKGKLRVILRKFPEKDFRFQFEEDILRRLLLPLLLLPVVIGIAVFCFGSVSDGARWIVREVPVDAPAGVDVFRCEEGSEAVLAASGVAARREVPLLSRSGSSSVRLPAYRGGGPLIFNRAGSAAAGPKPGFIPRRRESHVMPALRGRRILPVRAGPEFFLIGA